VSHEGQVARAVAHADAEDGAVLGSVVLLQVGDGVRLMAQWNLFASALPLHNARCLPGAAQTLQMVGERLYKLL